MVMRKLKMVDGLLRRSANERKMLRPPTANSFWPPAAAAPARGSSTVAETAARASSARLGSCSSSYEAASTAATSSSSNAATAAAATAAGQQRSHTNSALAPPQGRVPIPRALESRTSVSTARGLKPNLGGGYDQDIYEQLFAPFGVSESNFVELMRIATRCKSSPGTVIVQGGSDNRKLVLMVTGEAIAHKYDEGKDATMGKPVCRYTGRLSGAQDADPSDVPIRGSVIGGSALIDMGVLSKAYPHHIVAKTEVEYVEWEYDMLHDEINQKYRRALQASFYHLLYQELLSTLQRDSEARKFRKLAKEEDKDGKAQAPTTGQLFNLSIFVAVPFCGFGFADNFIMIVCGDMIDAQFGTMLGLTTLAAAGLGNWVSDVVGLGLGDAIERFASRLGLNNGNLTPTQEKMQSAKFTALAARIVGITIGCFAGMCPLLFLTPTKKEFTNEDIHLYDMAFRPCGTTTTQFSELMDRGKRCSGREGQVIVHGGTQQKKAILLLHGEAAAYEYDDGKPNHQGKACGRYVGRLDERVNVTEDKVRGSIIGGSMLAGETAKDTPYPRVVVGLTHLEWVEWDLKELKDLMEEDKTIQSSFLSIIHGDVISQLRRDRDNFRINSYRALVQTIILDGTVSDDERKKLEEYKEKLGITDEEHARIILDEGWTREDWVRGHRDNRQPIKVAGSVAVDDDNLTDVQKLERAIQAVALIAKRLGEKKEKQPKQEVTEPDFEDFPDLLEPKGGSSSGEATSGFSDFEANFPEPAFDLLLEPVVPGDP